MVLEHVDWPVVYAVMVASLPAVAWFFRLRRGMLARMSAVVKALEDSVRPKDKRYWLLGYLVGFRATYWVRRRPVSKVWALYTTPPYHVFFYLPVVLLARKRERLEVTLGLSQGLLRGEAHLYDPRDRRSRRAVRVDAGRLHARLKAARGPGGTVALHNSDHALRLATELYERLSKHLPVSRVSVIASRSVLHVAMEPRLEGLRQALKELMDFAYGLGRAPPRGASE